MIRISDVANKLKNFLAQKGEDKFKIFIRVNCSIDVYVLTSNLPLASQYENDFYKELCSLTGEDGEFYNLHKKNLRITFSLVNREEAEDDPYYANMFANENDTIDWGPRYRFDSLLKPKSSISAKGKSKAPIVTFYSYKGGMGRTTTMIAYAMSLAVNDNPAKRKRVVIIDCDLEAPGYLNFFNLSEHNGLRSGKKNGLVEFLSDAQLTSKPDDLDLNDYIINVGLDNKDDFSYNNLDNVWLIPAGNLNEGYLDVELHRDRNNYLEGLAKVNLSSVNSVVNHFNCLLDKINETIQPDIILLDSRTGFNDVFGTAALYLSSWVVGFFGFSRQTQPGLMTLLNEYYKPDNNFKLSIVFSIIPSNATPDWLESHKQQILEYINYTGSEVVDYPSFFYLHRNSILETIGTGDGKSDEEFVKLVHSNNFEDYKLIFESINNTYFKESEARFSVNTPAITLRNTVLKNLKNSLASVSNFAEDTSITDKQFFYRKCMVDLFNPKKFLIQGYKGTGKTYLYKALTDNEISSQIQQLSGIPADHHKSLFVNILPTTGDKYAVPFGYIEYSKIQEPEFYFNFFWQIFTWNSLLLQPEFKGIKENSELAEFIKPITDGLDTYIRFQEVINIGIKALVIIKNDIKAVNDYLKENNCKLYVLYDRLDTCVNPTKWEKAVSPLINYWRDNCEAYSNIVPKIFVRTDLFDQIKGTNTDRLLSNIIDIEWSIGEVFGYFFKLIFSNEESAQAYWTIAEKVGISEDYINNTKKQFLKFPYNQFETFDLPSMSQVIQVFFGKSVNVKEAKLGDPWTYFSKELRNANGGISLRPFINTLDSNAVEQALSETKKYIREIISPEIYASKSVREKTTNRYFDDLTQDEFSKDLRYLRDIIGSDYGKKYQFKSLTEYLFEELVNDVFSRIHESEVISSPKDLKDMIMANGIMAKVPTRDGTYYRFASIYWYSWGLVNSDLENEEKRKTNTKNSVKILEEDKTYMGQIIEVKDLYGRIRKRIKCENHPQPLEIRDDFVNELCEDDVVIFTAKKEANRNNPKKSFWYAIDVSVKES